MAGLVPAIHVFVSNKQDVDARVKPGHDVERSCNLYATAAFTGREIASTINAATTHSAPATKKAGK